ncbi:unnamed protein product [Cylicocyclus nassatus]|uniref:Uncharacterized protein n=1 Tax=Cylicocyclus nassatus TaxID=53992 RepID=A0AA36GNZ4_CYLNA|nr:unnamed protein product [Cylicocyclus nassatus]
MNTSIEDPNSGKPPKPFEMTRESLELLDKEELVERLLSLTDQLQDAKERAQRAKRRETLARLQSIQKDKELGDLKRERSDAFYGNGNPRSQLLDPFYYEAYTAVKEKVKGREETLAEQEETINTLQSSEQTKRLRRYVKSREDVSKKSREFELNLKRKKRLGDRITTANAALRAVLEETKGTTEEIVKKDAQIAELYREIISLRGELSEDVVFDMDADVGEKPLPGSDMGEEEEEEIEQISGTEEAESDDDVIILDDSDVDLSVLHRSSEDGDNGNHSGSEDRAVSVDGDTLKITI